MSESQEAPAAAMLPAGPVVPQFSGRRGALFMLVLKTMGLTLLTLGIYRFWAKTRLRRYFWGNVVIAGEPLEYTGKATELLVGFLIVIAVLVPLSVASSVLRLVAEGGSEWIGVALDVGYFAVLLFLIDFAVYRMWRYRLTRTRWRGIRFGMENGALKYAGRAFLWRIGQVLTLGFITPWARLDLAKFRVARMRLGNQTIAMNGPARPLVLRWLGVWGIPIAIVAGTLALGYGDTIFALLDDAQISGGSPGKAIAAVVIAILAGFILFVLYRIFEGRYLLGLTTVGGARLESRLRARAILPAFVLAWTIVLILFAVVLGFAFVPVVGGMASPANQMVGMVVGIAVAVLMLVLLPLITYPIAVFQTVRHVWTTLSIHDIDDLDRVTQAPKEEPRFGEGLADALDVGAI
ncbi:MAG: DUF898 family protein [Rhodospirillales bacterium]|nr:DUF898 family protein [Rhodospirillales bacterium]